MWIETGETNCKYISLLHTYLWSSISDIALQSNFCRLHLIMEPSNAASVTKCAEKLNVMDLYQRVVTGLTSTLWLFISTLQFLSRQPRCVKSCLENSFESVKYYFNFNILIRIITWFRRLPSLSWSQIYPVLSFPNSLIPFFQNNSLQLTILSHPVSNSIYHYVQSIYNTIIVTAPNFPILIPSHLMLHTLFVFSINTIHLACLIHLNLITLTICNTDTLYSIDTV